MLRTPVRGDTPSSPQRRQKGEVQMLQDSCVHPERLLRWLLVTVAALVVTGVATAAINTYYGYSARDLFIRFDLASDPSVPTFFSSAMLSLAALLLMAMGRSEVKASTRRAWQFLAVLFLGMAIDEIARFHEWVGDAAEISSDGFFYYSWVYFGIAGVAVVGAVYLPFVLRLPRRLRFLIILAAALFVAGGLGMEMINASLDSSAGAESFRFTLQTAVEETGEMIGVVVLVYALLDELRRREVSWLIDALPTQIDVRSSQDAS
ncbi:MAG TPA: hypothetical protein PLP26_03680 [Ilumatobacteraceae bacterium]|nr:hypothetical protein [Ilumatobacteraceae bacterium]